MADNKETKKDQKTMSNPQTHQNAGHGKSNPPPAAANAKTPTPAADAPKPAAEGKKKSKKASFVSPKDATYGVRRNKATAEKHGPPTDPWGNKMVAGKAVGGGGGGGGSKSKAEKEAAEKLEQEKMAKMTDAEKLAYTKEKREAKVAQRAAKKQAERDALIAQLKEEIKAGRA